MPTVPVEKFLGEIYKITLRVIATVTYCWEYSRLVEIFLRIPITPLTIDHCHLTTAITSLIVLWRSMLSNCLGRYELR